MDRSEGDPRHAAVLDRGRRCAGAGGFPVSTDVALPAVAQGVRAVRRGMASVTAANLPPSRSQGAFRTGPACYLLPYPVATVTGAVPELPTSRVPRRYRDPSLMGGGRP